MDEILIEDKKYISSKQAAKMTGYAKDYVGQLCREGRVPARLVGRGWYVLESAIQDHRFGNPNEPVQEEKKPEVEPATAKTWEFPRYETIEAEILPLINRLEEENKTVELPEEGKTEEIEEVAPQSAPSVHDSWRQWFDQVATTAKEESTDTVTAEEELVEEQYSEEPIEEAQVNVPLRVVSNYFPTKEIQPNYPEVAATVTKPEEAPIKKPKKSSGALVRSIQSAAILIMSIFVYLAVAGSGYFDAHLISNSQADLLIGISVYNK